MNKKLRTKLLILIGVINLPFFAVVFFNFVYTLTGSNCDPSLDWHDPFTYFMVAILMCWVIPPIFAWIMIYQAEVI